MLFCNQERAEQSLDLEKIPRLSSSPQFKRPSYGGAGLAFRLAMEGHVYLQPRSTGVALEPSLDGGRPRLFPCIY